MNDQTEPEGATEREVLAATLRFNTRVFSIILGLFAGTALFALSVFAQYNRPHGVLAVALIGIFLPGYGPDWPGALIGLFWGVVFGALLGMAIYRINARHVLDKIDELVIAERASGEFPRAVLRLDGPSLGLAIGAIGALGLVATTNILVARGTAAQSVHARLLGEVLPGYTVSVVGSVIGAIELFAVLYVFCLAFASIYNRVAERRQRR
jgi:hypothetical protein